MCWQHEDTPAPSAGGDDLAGLDCARIASIVGADPDLVGWILEESGAARKVREQAEEIERLTALNDATYRDHLAQMTRVEAERDAANARIDAVRALAEQIEATPPEPESDGWSQRSFKRSVRRGIGRSAALSIAAQIRRALDPTTSTEKP